MNILLLTQYFHPEPAGKLSDTAKELTARGHQVEVLTGFPCYPHGKIYSGYRQGIRHVESIDGYNVIRVPQFPDHSRSIIKRVLYYCTFALSAVILGLLRVNRPQVILVYQSALPTGCAAWLLSRLWRVPYVIDLADLWPESLAASGMLQNKVVMGIVRIVAKFVYAGANQINVITEGYQSILIGMGISERKINLVRSWGEKGAFDPVEPDAEFALNEGLSSRFNITYAGAMGPCQQLETVIAAAEMISDLPEVQFVLAGDGTSRDEIAQAISDRQLGNVRLIGRRSQQEINKIFAHSELLLVHLKKDPMSEVSIPSKTIDYLCSGRPLLMAVAGEASRIVEENGCGVVVRPSSAVEMADGIRDFYGLIQAERDRMAKASRETYVKLFNREDQFRKLEASLENATSEHRVSWYHRRGKRWFDLMVSVPALIFLSPLLLMIAVAVRANLGTPICFKQARPGRNGKLFAMYKFRSMRQAYDAYGKPLPDDQRMTRLGQWLRSTSLDELPELWNVIRGDMSLVGPRPLLVEYLERYDEHQIRRHEVRPGLTGLAQVNGRNAISWEEKFELDVQYVDTYSFRTDLQILGKTVNKVLRRSDVSAKGFATMPEFTGAPHGRVDERLAA